MSYLIVRVSSLWLCTHLGFPNHEGSQLVSSVGPIQWACIALHSKAFMYAPGLSFFVILGILKKDKLCCNHSCCQVTCCCWMSSTWSMACNVCPGSFRCSIIASCISAYCLFNCIWKFLSQCTTVMIITGMVRWWYSEYMGHCPQLTCHALVLKKKKGKMRVIMWYGYLCGCACITVTFHGAFPPLHIIHAPTIGIMMTEGPWSCYLSQIPMDLTQVLMAPRYSPGSTDAFSRALFFLVLGL